jgi:hypothetical protein
MSRLTGLVVLLACCSYAQPTPHFSFAIETTGDYQSEIRSFVGRELRSLGDVDVTNTDAQYTISIVTLKTQNKAGEDIGYAMSVVLISRMTDATCELLKNEVVCDWLKGKVKLENQMIFIGGSQDGLRKHCNKIVAGIDSDVLQPTRDTLLKLKSWSARPKVLQ